MLSRDEMISELCFRPDEGMWISGKLPTRFVTIGGTADDYTDDELALLVTFTQGRQAAYERRYSAKFDWRDNFICFERENDRWGRKRLSWREGRMHSSSLPEAIATFWGDHSGEAAVGQFCVLKNGQIAEVIAEIPYMAKDSMDFECRNLVSGETVQISRYEIGVATIAAPSLESLGDQIRMAMHHRIARLAGQSGEVDAVREAITESNDPADLREMWSCRLRDFWEVNYS